MVNCLAKNEKNRIELNKCDICLWDIMIDVQRKLKSVKSVKSRNLPDLF